MSELRGFDALDLDSPALVDARNEQNAQIKQVNSDFRELFCDSELGKRVLSVLDDWTINQPDVYPEESDKMTAFRGGKCDIVRSIHYAIKASSDS